MQIPDINLGTWRDCLWTGVALRACRKDVSMSIIKDEEGKDIPAMPDQLFGRVGEFMTLFVEVNPSHPLACEQYDMSLSVKTDIRNVPLKPNPDKLSLPQHRHALLSGTDKIDNLVTDRIINKNIGSNSGLLRILRDHYEDSGQSTGACERYTALNVDINIFERIVKVELAHVCVCVCVYVCVCSCVNVCVLVCVFPG